MDLGIVNSNKNSIWQLMCETINIVIYRKHFSITQSFIKRCMQCKEIEMNWLNIILPNQQVASQSIRQSCVFKHNYCHIAALNFV